jgi:hypothetical protein
MAKGQQQDQSGTAQSGYNKPARPEWGQASWYQQHIPSQLVKGQANQLGISTDQMYQIYAQQGLGPSAIGQGAGAWSNPNQGGGAGTGGQWIPSTPGVISGVQQAQQARSTGNILWPQQAQQTSGQTPGQPPAAPGGQGWLVGSQPAPLQFPQVSTPPTLRVGQAMPALPAGADLTGAMTQAQVAQQVGTQPVYVGANPGPLQFAPVSPPPTLQVGQAMPQPPGVQRYQSGGMVQQIQPGVTRDAQGQVTYTDPALQTQLGLGNLTTSQQTALGLDPTHAQALSGATQVAAQYQPYFLGAAALNMPAVINLPPSGTPSSRSGVAATPGAIVGNAVPQTPQGPWLTNPSVFARATPNQPTAAPTITPQTPATAVSYAPGQAFATPPAAPSAIPSTLPPTMAQSGATTTSPPTAMLPPGFMGGAQGAGYVPQGFLQAHTSALANAGMALYSHFGGDPNSASPTDIANFHTQLTGAVGQHIAANQPAAGVKKAATGGMVPGRGSGDIVPALLEPGEYVIPKDQVAQMVARGVLKLQSGGMVPDNQSNQPPPEARRQTLTTQSGTGNAPGTSQPSGQPSSSSAQSSSPQIGGGSSLFSGLAQAAHTYGNSIRSPASGGGYSVPGGYIGASPGPGQSGYMYPSQAAATAAGDVGTGVGGGGMSGSGLKSALGGVASGLNQASQALGSVAQQRWQMQQSAIPDPSQLPKYQTPTLQQARVA